MAISPLSLIKSGAQLEPPNILLHGVAGVGKTTFAAQSDRPIIVCTENGLGVLDVPHFPLARSFDGVIAALKALHEEEHAYRTVVIDSIDWLEPLIWARTCAENDWENIEAAGYGKGYAAALDVWRDYLVWLDALRVDRGMTVIQIAHTDIRRFDNPESDPYDRYVIKLHARASALLQEHSDVVLFANYRISTVKSDVGFNKKVTRALGSGQRVLYTNERPAFLAKNRFELPDSLDLDWQAFAEAMPHYPSSNQTPNQKEA
jgi:AAA domain